MKYLLNIFKCLQRTEKRKLLLLSFGDALTSLLDLGALGALLWILNRDPGSLWPALVLLFLFAVKNAWAYRLSVWQYRFIYQVGLRLSEQQLIKYLEQDYLSFVQTDSSTHIHRVKHQPIEFAQYELRGLQQILAQSLLITLTIGALLWYQPILFLWLVGLLLPVCLCAMALIKTTMNKARRSVKETGQSALQHLQQTIGAYIEINTYRKADFFLKRFLHQERDFTYILSRQQSLQGFPSRFMEVFAVGGLVLLLFLHHHLSGSGAVPYVMIGAFMGAAYKIIPGLVIIINSASLLKAYAYTAHDPETTASSSEVDPLTEPLRSIQIDGLSFHYGPNIIFKNLQLRMEAGDCIALQGFSGREKQRLPISSWVSWSQPLEPFTSMIYLLMRLPEGGFGPGWPICSKSLFYSTIAS